MAAESCAIRSSSPRASWRRRGSSLQRSGPAPANGLPRKGRDVRVVGAASWPPLPCSGRPAPWAGWPSAPWPPPTVRACGFSPRCSERAPAVSSPSSPWPGRSVVAVFDMREILVALCAALCVQWVPFVAVGFMGAVAKGALAGVLPLLSWWCLRGFGDELSEIVSAVAIRPASTMRPTVPAGADVGSDHVTARLSGALFSLRLHCRVRVDLQCGHDERAVGRRGCSGSSMFACWGRPFSSWASFWD